MDDKSCATFHISHHSAGILRNVVARSVGWERFKYAQVAMIISSDKSELEISRGKPLASNHIHVHTKYICIVSHKAVRIHTSSSGLRSTSPGGSLLRASCAGWWEGGGA